MITSAISASVMILVIIVLRLLLLKRLPKRCFRILWILALLRLLIPFSFNFEVEIEAQQTANPAQTVYIDESNATSNVMYMGDDNAEEAAHFSLGAIIKSIYIFGTVIIAGFLISAYVRMRKIALHSKPVSEKYGLHMHGIDVRSGDGTDMPFSCGVFRPIIFIPSQMLTLDNVRLNMIIAHESRHIKSADQLVKWFIAAALCLNWYNPLVWVMWQLANRDIELACDEAVLSGGTNNYAYALCLIAAEETRMTGAVCSFGAPLLNERIEFIMKSKKLTICSFIAAGLILAMMTVFFVSVTAVEAESKTESETESEVVTTLVEPEETDDLSIEIEVEDVKGTPADSEVDFAEELDLSSDIFAQEPSVYAEIIYDETAVEVFYEVTTVEDIYIDDVECEIGEVVLQHSQPIPGFGFSCPLNEYGDITGHFGSHTNPLGVVTYNNGVNVSAVLGADVFAAADGKVTACGYNTSVGNFIEIDHGDGWLTVYHHLEKSLVSVGDEVSGGEKIGVVGSTGEVTGPNLGFAIIKDGAYLDPEPIFSE